VIYNILGSLDIPELVRIGNMSWLYFICSMNGNLKLLLSRPELIEKGNADSVESCAVVSRQHPFADLCSTYYKEWTSLLYAEDMRLEVSSEHPFTITLDLKYPQFVDLTDEMNTARLFVGIKEEQNEYQPSTELGVYMGRLYLKDLFDRVNIPKEKLVAGVKFMLQVCPIYGDTKCVTTLKVLDESGFEITSIKTKKFLKTDWMGGISSGAHFKSLRIEGVQP